MSVPDFQAFLLPVLDYARDGGDRTLRDTYTHVAQALHLTEADRRELLPSRKQLTFHNRAGWAKTYLLKAGLLEGVGRGTFHITTRGREVLASNPTRLTRDDLLRFPEFAAFAQVPENGATPGTSMPTVETVTPDEQMERLHARLRAGLAQEVLDLARTCPPAFFEQLVVDVLVAMGYGGSLKDAGRAIGRTGDGGIDGIIKRDPLGLENIYVQAKRWANNVGSPEVRAFAGALQEHKASRGVLITTSGFTRDSVEVARRLGTIVLVDGEELARLMIDYGVGVTTAVVYEVKRIDKDYFDQE